MAPLAADPRQILVVLNQAKRKALYILILDIIDAMRSQLELGNTTPYPGHPSASGRTGQPGVGPRIQADADTVSTKRLEPQNTELVALRRDALKHFDDWRAEVLKKLKDIVSAAEDSKILEARKKRDEDMAKLKPGPQEGDLVSVGTSENSDTSNARRVCTLRQHYPPVPTRLTTIPEEDRREVLSCVLLVMLSTGHYAAHSRVLALYLTSSLDLPLAILITEETEIAKHLLLQSSSAAENNNSPGNRDSARSQPPGAMSGDAEVARRRQENQTSRFWKVGLASVAGAAVIGVTGGLAAPVVAGALGGIMGGLGLGGVASFLGLFWANGALVGALFGAYGAKMTGEMMDAYAREVNDFCFLPLRGGKPKVRGPGGAAATSSAASPTGNAAAHDIQEHRRLRVTVGVNGWLKEEADVTKPWRVLADESEVFALRYEIDALLALGSSLDKLVASYAWKYVKMEILKNTVLASLRAVLWPAYLLSTASNIDNPFSLARNRSEKAGRVLADALINRAQGERPVTLIGYSLGARAIYTCLRTLADRRAFGLVDTVVLIGAPAPSSTTHWQLLRSVVAGRIFNVYSENDYILGFLYRATSLQLGIAGLQPITGVPGIENLDLSREVAGHLRYPHLIAQILTRCGFPNVKGGEAAIERDEDLDRAERVTQDDLPREARAVRGDAGVGSTSGIGPGEGEKRP